MRKLPPNPLRSAAKRRISQVAHIGTVAAFLLGSGCAKFPDGIISPDSTRLIFTMRTDGALRFGDEPGGSGTPYVYMVVLRASTDRNPTDSGPVPIVSPPWGNGFVAGNATQFVWWDPTQGGAQYILYRFNSANLEQWFAAGVPINSVIANAGGKELKFELTLSQIESDPVKAAELKSIQVNFLTMDRIPTGGVTKFWDALGDGRLPSQINTWITLPLDASAVVNNTSTGEIEPIGDQADPSLDLGFWQIEVRRG